MMNQNRQAERISTRIFHLSRGGWLLAAATVLLCMVMAPDAQAQRLSEKVQDRVRGATGYVSSWISEQNEADKYLIGGYGFFINRTGLFMTCNSNVDYAHLRDRRDRQAIQYQNLNRVLYKVHLPREGAEETVTYRAKLKYQNERANVAILQVFEDKDFREDFLDTSDFLRIREGNTIDPGEPAWLWGNPFLRRTQGSKNTQEEGDWSILVDRTYAPVTEVQHRIDGDIKAILIDYLVPYMEIESDQNLRLFVGGPVVDSQGQVIGASTYQSSMFEMKLVPGDLMKECISTAFDRGKLDEEIDIEPFYSLLTNHKGSMAIPTLERSEGTDCIYLSDGQKLCGTPVSDTLKIPSTMGELTIPCDIIAYLIPQDEELGIALLDGGQRFPFYINELSLEFLLPGNQKYEVDFASTRAVAFRNDHPLPTPPTGKGYLLNGPDYNLNLKDVTGKTTFMIMDADIDVEKSLDEIKAIKKYENDTSLQLATFRNGTRAAGEFSDETTLETRIPLDGAMQHLSLNQVFNVSIENANFDKQLNFVRDISEIIPDFGTDKLAEIAKLIDNNKLEDAEKKLEGITETGITGYRLRLLKSQIHLLKGITAWRQGNFRGAEKHLKKARYTDDEFCQNYAQAMLAMYDRWPKGKFADGKSLSDMKVFQQAALELAQEYKAKALDGLAGREMIDVRQMVWHDNFPSRVQFMRSRKKFIDSCDNLDIASLLGDPMADWIKIQTLNIAREVYLAERVRMEMEMQDPEADRNEREEKKLQEQYEKTLEWAQELDRAIEDIGFINSDPDKMHVRVIEANVPTPEEENQ